MESRLGEKEAISEGGGINISQAKFFIIVFLISQSVFSSREKQEH